MTHILPDTAPRAAAASSFASTAASSAASTAVSTAVSAAASLGASSTASGDASGHGSSAPGSAPRPLAGAQLDAVVPLAMLASVRALDLPAIDLETELVHELRNKRFGLSDTVYRQIKRYAEAVRRQEPVSVADAVALARLVGRRPDADLVFREAGRFVANAALETLSAPTRRLTRSLPGAMARPLALRHLRALCRRFLLGTLERQGSTLLLDVRAPVMADASPHAAGCAFYSAALYALMLGLTGRDAPVQEVSCVERGDATCQWRTEWRRS